MKIIRSSLSEFMQSLLKAAIMLNFMMNLHSVIWVSVSLIKGNEYWSFFVRELSF